MSRQTPACLARNIEAVSSEFLPRQFHSRLAAYTENCTHKSDVGQFTFIFCLSTPQANHNFPDFSLIFPNFVDFTQPISNCRFQVFGRP